MVRKEDLCDWFKALPAHKRVDYMCGLLHMCHPLELRFTGTVLEDLAKKDFHYLRDQEIKANQRSDLSSNNSNSLSDQKLRAKIITALALMNSTNFPCAEVIFEILQQQFDSFLGLLHNAVNAADLIMILTMAVHHPAFTFYQKDRLGQVLERVEVHLRELYGDDDDERDLILQSQTLTPETIIQPSSLNSTQSPVLQPEKVTVTAIEVINVEPSQNRKEGDQFQIHTTWSNEEVTEVFLSFKQIHELQHKILNKFPEEKKTHAFVLPGKHTLKAESLSDQKRSLNNYFSKLAKAPAHILDCDILTGPLRSGTLVNQPKSASITHATSSTTISHAQAVFIQTSPLQEDRNFRSDFSPYHHPIMMSYSGMVPNSSICSPGASQMSSAATSPANSRTSSPILLASSIGGKNSYTSSSANMKGNNAVMSGISVSQPVRNCDQISQLLHVLNLEEYFDNLKDYPFHQIVHMSKEEFAKAGLPADAQIKLKSKLDQIKPTDLNGLVDQSRFPSPETSRAFYQPFCYHPQFTFITPPYQHFIHPSAYAAQSGHISVLSSSLSHIPVSENSPVNSEASSPPPSPLHPVSGMPLEQGHIINQIQPVPGPNVHMMSPPPAFAGDLLDGKSSMSSKTQLFDSSGSEEERAGGYGLELGSLKNKGHGRPQQSRSLPLINQSTMSVSSMEAAKLTGIPISMSAPHSHPVHMNTEPSTSNTPPLQAISAVAVSHISPNPTAAVVNGYISDPPPIQPHGGAPNIGSRAIMNSRTFKTAQPAHTSLGVHKNIMNMPTPDISHPLSNHGKNGAGTSSLPILHGNMSHQTYSIGPSIASVPPTHVLGLSPLNFPANTIQLGPPQPSPNQSLISDGNNAYPVLMYSQPRGILTTIANSAAIMTSTQSHHTGPPMSHSPSPAGTSVCTDQIPGPPYGTEVLDPCRSEGSSLTPPVQTPVPISGVKSQIHAGGTNSSTPSPPLVPGTKQLGTNETQPVNRGPQMYGYINGFLPQIIYPQQGHQPPHFPNGITADYGGWLRLPHQVASSHFPIMYGFPPQNMSGTLHAAPSGQVASTNQSHSSGAVNGKRCYNCGLAGHKASECNEIRMENMSNTFHLSYKPSEPPA